MKVVLASAVVSFLACLLLVPFLMHSPGVSAAAASASQIPPPPPGGRITCASDDMRRKYCAVDTRGGVQLVNQRSGSPCVFGQTWGWDKRGVWVDRGCRADFMIGYYGGNNPGGPGWPGWGNNYNVYCASDDGRRNNCPIYTGGGVRLVRQRSGSPCVYGQTWGWDKRGIWVDRGCRADFEIGQSGWQPPSQQVVYCASNNMGRQVCPANTRNGVRIIRQRSDSDCIYNRTWGYDNRGIWVDRGCRADFELGLR
jgi:hypothetical protein